MTQIASRWAGVHALLIHIKNELVVRAQVHDKVLLLLRKLKQLPEVQYGLVALWAVWGGYPLGAPHLFRIISGKLCPRNFRIYQLEYRNHEQPRQVLGSLQVLLFRRANRIIS